VRLVRLAAIGCACAVLTAQGSSMPRQHATTKGHSEATASLRITAGDVPAGFSFDDLRPLRAAARAAVRTSPVPSRVRPAAPKRTPRTTSVVDSPPPGTAQAVLAAAYRKAVASAPSACHLRAAHLAAIGQVESGSVGGRSVTADHVVSPAIYGPLLDGGPFAVVVDTDNGSYDGASDYDRAVGPMQFLPGTWKWAGRDGDGDGRQDPQNVFDAALATADYLCRDGRDLSRASDLQDAVWSYNQSGAYHAAVVEWVSYFDRHGLVALTAVAFRVGSGGRASDLAQRPVPAPAPTDEPHPSAGAPAEPAAGPTTSPTATATTSATGTTRATTTPTPTTTTPGTTTTSATGTIPPSPVTSGTPTASTTGPVPTVMAPPM
jgi:membrane-bound lytic murein transglycosylase B